MVTKILFTSAMFAVSIWLLVGFLYIYNGWHEDVFREGYLRGAKHTEIYYRQKGKFPPVEWKERARWWVNEDNSPWIETVWPNIRYNYVSDNSSYGIHAYNKTGYYPSLETWY